jgi:SAM-dependent methyltransferase
VDQNKVQWVYAAKDRHDLASRYDEWAKDYDSNLERDFAWNGHVLCAELLAKYVTSDARVLDVGAGAGLAGFELMKRGFSLLDGFDLSEGMLDEARKLDVYVQLKKGILGEPLDYPTAAYDAAIASGVFTVGHAPASGWDEVARVVKPGGYFVLTLRPDVYEPNGFKAKDGELTASGKWKLVELTDEQALRPKGEPEIQHQLCVYEILK